jgi:hypothetical protein
MLVCRIWGRLPATTTAQNWNICVVALRRKDVSASDKYSALYAIPQGGATRRPLTYYDRYRLLPAGRCPGPGCGDQIDRTRLICRRDWYLAPRQPRDRAWATWRSGQGAAGRGHQEAVFQAIAACHLAWLPGCRRQLIRFRLLPGPGQRRDPAAWMIKEFPGRGLPAGRQERPDTQQAWRRQLRVPTAAASGKHASGLVKPPAGRDAAADLLARP